MKKLKPHTLKMFKNALFRIDDDLMEAQLSLNKKPDRAMDMLVKNRDEGPRRAEGINTSA